VPESVNAANALLSSIELHLRLAEGKSAVVNQAVSANVPFFSVYYFIEQRVSANLERVLRLNGDFHDAFASFAKNAVGFANFV
jgi:hypothetical protein